MLLVRRPCQACFTSSKQQPRYLSRRLFVMSNALLPLKPHSRTHGTGLQRLARRTPHSQGTSSPASTASPATSYATALAQLEERNDWVGALELLTEVKILKVELAPSVLEIGVRTFSRGGQWQRAADLFDRVCSDSHTPSLETVSTLFDALYNGQQGDRAEHLLQRLLAISYPGDLSPAHNTVSRTLARQGEVVRAQDMVEAMLKSDNLRVEDHTYTVLLSELYESGEMERVADVLEWRDYL